MRALVVIALMAGVAGACPQTGYVVRAGSLSPGPRCNGFIVATSPTGPDRATGTVTIKRDVSGDFDVALSWRALTAQPVTLELYVPGGYLLMRDGGIGLYTSEAAWAQRGYSPIAALHITSVVDLRIRVRGGVLTASIGDAVVGTWKLPAQPVGNLEVGLVGPSGERSRMWFGGVSVTSTTDRTR